MSKSIIFNEESDNSGETKFSSRLNWVVTIILIIIVAVASNIFWGIGIALLVYFIQYFKQPQSTKQAIKKEITDEITTK